MFAGPGIYEDGNTSTPILIGKYREKDSELKANVWLIFNDNTYSETLKANFQKEFNENTFFHKPHFGKGTVGECKEISDFLIKSTHVDNKANAPSQAHLPVPQSQHTKALQNTYIVQQDFIFVESRMFTRL